MYHALNWFGFVLALVACLLGVTSTVLHNWITIRRALRGAHKIVNRFVEGRPWD